MFINLRPVVLFCLIFTVITFGCRRNETFPAIGDRIVSPIDTAVSDDGQHFFALNTDVERTYNSGSIVTIDTEG